MSKPYRMPVTLKVDGPVLTNASVRGAFGVDAYMARSGGKYYLPGTQIRGLVRMALEQIQSAGVDIGIDLCAVFGKPTESDTNNEPARGQLTFPDLTDPKPSTVADSPLRYRLRQDYERGAAREQHLMILETPYSEGHRVTFQGSAIILALPEEATAIRKAVSKAFGWIAAVGAERSIGFGKLASATCEEPRAVQPSPDVPARDEPAKEWFTLDITPEGPFCLSERRVADNLFESATFIPGAAIKGCIAPLLDSSALPYLDKARFSHAFPSDADGQRETVAPLSLAAYKKAKLTDVLAQTEPFLLDGEPPRFWHDWKDADRSAVSELLQAPTIKHELRVRTEISPQTGRANDEHLFALRLVLPEQNIWRGHLCLTEVPEAARASILRVLRLGLYGVGKLKTAAGVAIHAMDAPRIPDPLESGDYAVMLRTHALMLRGDSPAFRSVEMKKDLLRKEYEVYWNSVSGGALELVNYFQKNSLAGGNYYAHRFQTNGTYRPYLLTDPGSVFLLRPAAGKNAEARTCLEGLLRRGLPIPAEVASFYEFDLSDPDVWKRCPYLPQSGYGEIVLNHSIHTKCPVGEGVLEVICDGAA